MVGGTLILGITIGFERKVEDVSGGGM